MNRLINNKFYFFKYQGVIFAGKYYEGIDCFKYYPGRNAAFASRDEVTVYSEADGFNAA